MTNRLDKSLQALRLLAQSSEPEATRLMTAEVRIREFLRPVAADRAARRSAQEDFKSAVKREAELRPQEASFWKAIVDFIAQRLAMLGDS